MPIFNIPVTWSMYGVMSITANSLDDAIRYATDYEPLPKGDYINASLEIDYEGLAINNEDEKEEATYTFHIDGGSRGNPGIASIGIVISVNNEIVDTISKYIGETTNNVAEYKALIEALDYAWYNKITKVKIFSDSELMVKQINGEYKVKDNKLKLLYANVKELIKELKEFEIVHIKREFNKEADKLCNEALDNLECDNNSECDHLIVIRRYNEANI